MAAQQPGWAPRLVVSVATAVTVAAVVALGIYVTGGLITNDARASMLLATVWLAVSAAAVAVLVRRRRQLAVPAVGAWVITALGVGGFLLYTSTVDTVVHEKVVRAASAEPAASPPSTSGSSASPASPALPAPTSATAPAAPTVVTAGTFRAQAHPTSGTAQVIDLPGGKRVLTLTGFATEPGPDVRVYLVPGDGSSVAKAVDLGGLKGNKGDQQYSVPDNAPIGAVVLWCRSFSVAFGAAALHT